MKSRTFYEQEIERLEQKKIKLKEKEKLRNKYVELKSEVEGGFIINLINVFKKLKRKEEY